MRPSNTSWLKRSGLATRVRCVVVAAFAQVMNTPVHTRSCSCREVYEIIDLRSSLDQPLGDAIETFIRREDAKRFIEEVRGEDPDLARYLRIEERELEIGSPN